MKTYIVMFLISSVLLSFSSAEQCGWQAGGELCPNGLCCSGYGWCGTTDDYCKPPGCQSQCTPDGPTPSLSDIITRSLFEKMLINRNEDRCPAKGFYTYDAFITAAKSFPEFGTIGDTATRKKEIAAFFGQTSHQTTGGAPGQYSWGYCRKDTTGPHSQYCYPSTWSCVAGELYYGRGPIQLTWNYNYGPCGQAIGVDLLSNPDIVSKDAVIAFKTAIWFWMTPQSPKPSCHAVITGQWEPSDADRAAERLPGYGVITNIIAGDACGHGGNSGNDDRTGYYLRYCEMFGVDAGPNLDCGNQKPFGSLVLDAAAI